MATSEQIRNRIITLVVGNEFNKDDLLQVFSQLVHEGILENEDIIKIIKYLAEDILQVQTKISLKNRINSKTGKNYSYNAHQFIKGERFFINPCHIEFIVDND
jgi:hypothetical protein